jgi:hypothetical protein
MPLPNEKNYFLLVRSEKRFPLFHKKKNRKRVGFYTLTKAQILIQALEKFPLKPKSQHQTN